MFKSLISIILTLITLANSTASYAQKNISSNTKIEVITLTSKHLKNDIQFNITLPASYQNKPDKRYVVLLDFHPRSQNYLSGLHDWLSHNGEWPWLETIIVTPSKNSQDFSKLYETMNSKQGGGALLDFIGNNLLAHVDKKYRSNGYRIFNGFRGNATLGLYVLLNKPSLFNAYIIASPSIADDYGKVVSQAGEKLAKLGDKPRYLFLSTGKHNYEKADLNAISKLQKSLEKSAPKALTWQVNHFDNSNFMSQPIIAVINAIEEIFADINHNLPASSEISQQGVKAIIAHYNYLSNEKYGFNVSAEGSINNLALSLLKAEPNRAIEILKTNMVAYPKSAYATHNVAKAYFETGNVEQAIKYQKQAVKLSKSMILWHINNIQKYLDKYQKAFNKT